VFESADTGDILCAVCPHAKLFVTAGASSVLNTRLSYPVDVVSVRMS